MNKRTVNLEDTINHWKTKDQSILMPSLLAKKQAVLEENRNQRINSLKSEL